MLAYFINILLLIKHYTPMEGIEITRTDEVMTPRSNHGTYRSDANAGYDDDELGFDMLVNETKLRENPVAMVDTSKLNLQEPDSPPYEPSPPASARASQPIVQPRSAEQPLHAPPPQQPIHPYLADDNASVASTVTTASTGPQGQSAVYSTQPSYQPTQPQNFNEYTEYNPEEMRRLKFKALADLRFFESRGMPLTRKFTMDDEYDDIVEELKIIKSTFRMDRNIDRSKQILVTATSMIEWANEKYNPFDFYLEGWSRNVDLDKDDYDDIIRELLDKHEDKIEQLMSPEFVFLMMYGGSAAAVHAANKDAKREEEKAKKARMASMAPPPSSRPRETRRAPTTRSPPMRTGDPELDAMMNDLPPRPPIR
jgi:hypothetical protein